MERTKNHAAVEWVNFEITLPILSNYNLDHMDYSPEWYLKDILLNLGFNEEESAYYPFDLTDYNNIQIWMSERYKIEA